MANGKSKKIGSDGGAGKLKAGALSALLPLALAELLVSKGIITQDELNKAIAKTLLEIIKPKVAEPKATKPRVTKRKIKANRR